MSIVELVQANLLSPVVLAFALGVIATMVKSDLRFPPDLYTALSMYLLIALGLKGGIELHSSNFHDIWAPAVATLMIGILSPILAIAVLRGVARFSMADSCAIAAHYGSVSVVTFMAALGFLDKMNISVENFMPTLVVILEIPAIIIAIAIATAFAKDEQSRRPWREVIHETVCGRSVLLLLGGLWIGFLSGPSGMAQIEAFFIAPFQGVLMLFLLEMGMIASRRFREFRKVGMLLIGFSLVMPLINGAIGVWFGYLAGLSLGGTMVLGTMAASASYIAAPAAVRIAIPEANPSYYLTMALGLTFPFNLVIGIPIYLNLARLLHG